MLDAGYYLLPLYMDTCEWNSPFVVHKERRTNGIKTTPGWVNDYLIFNLTVKHENAPIGQYPIFR